MSKRSRRAQKKSNRAKGLSQTVLVQKLLLKDPKEYTEKEAQYMLAVKLNSVKNTINRLKNSCEIFKNNFEGMVGEFNCFQFQMIGQDLASILSHIDDLETNGARPTHRDIPLEESEIAEEPMANVHPLPFNNERVNTPTTVVEDEFGVGPGTENLPEENLNKEFAEESKLQLAEDIKEEISDRLRDSINE